jgi:hypothetical protein
MANIARERRARRRAPRMSLGLHKSRTDGTWYVTDTWTRGVVFPTWQMTANPPSNGATLEQVEE